MPTLIQHEPDSFDLDYFLSKYSDRYDVVSREQNIAQLKPISFAFNPSQCAPAKQLHYFHVPSQPSLTNCLCNKYHTYFTSKHHTLEISRPSTPTPNSNIPTPMDITPKQYQKLQDQIPKSPVKQNTTSLPPFPFNYDTENTATSSTNLNPLGQQIPITAHSHHVHTCLVCHKKNIPCVFLSNGKHSLQSETVLKGFPVHSECINNIQIKPLPQSKPLTLTQQNTFYFIKFSLMSSDQKKVLFKSALRKLAKKPLLKRDTSNDLD